MPETVGQYALKKLLGVGGLGETWLAVNKADKPVALKRLTVDLSDDPEYVKKLNAAGKTAHSLKHPNIVSLLNAGIDNERAWLIYEFHDAVNLRDSLSASGLPSFQDVARIARGLLLGLSALHQTGQFHGGVSATNVLISRGAPLLTDIGQARDDGAIGVRLDAGAVAGLPHFIAPEQYRDGAALTSAIDIYSTGALLYYMTTGRAPFNGDSLAEVIRAVVSSAPPSPDIIRPDIPIGLSRLIVACLDKSPAGRPGSPTEVLSEIEAEFPDSGRADDDEMLIEIDSETAGRALIPLEPPTVIGDLDSIENLWLPGYEPPEPEPEPEPVPVAPNKDAEPLPIADMFGETDDAPSPIAEPKESKPDAPAPVAKPAQPKPVVHISRAQLEKATLKFSMDDGSDILLFLFAMRRLQFGRNSGDDSRNAFTLRLIPQSEFAEESRKISGSHLATEYADNAFHIVDLNSSNGTTLQRKALTSGKPAVISGRSKIDVGGALTMELLPISANGSAIDLPDIAPKSNSTDVGAEKTFAHDALVLKRINNAPGHIYAQVLRRLEIGGQATDKGLTLPLPSLPARAAEILYYRGVFFIRGLDSDVLIDGQGDGATAQPLTPGATGRIDDIRFHFGVMNWDQFKGR
ncbi:MAG: FHA domain-containing serine/threonine-protein kinase [Planctomycetota bacterium]